MDARVVRFWIWVAAAVFAAIALVGHLGPPLPTKSDRYAEKCMHANPKLPWIPGENGITVEEFCKAAGDYTALLDDKAERPEFYAK